MFVSGVHEKRCRRIRKSRAVPFALVLACSPLPLWDPLCPVTLTEFSDSFAPTTVTGAPHNRVLGGSLSLLSPKNRLKPLPLCDKVWPMSSICVLSTFFLLLFFSKGLRLAERFQIWNDFAPLCPGGHCTCLETIVTGTTEWGCAAGIQWVEAQGCC